ncbi:MAG: antibiotic biosynthesis monooxygenase [Actinomycetota bacterium]|nr:antibiotic biosynthesis monooxygenase [Actinomycetota bacterium]
MHGRHAVRLTGTITIPVGEQPGLRPLLDEHVRLTRDEPGCVEFEVVQDAERPDVFLVRELFLDESAFAFHQTRGAASPWGRASAHLQRDFTRTSVSGS